MKLLFFLLALCLPSARTPITHGLMDTELLIQVRLPDGSAAKGIKVQQIQLERTSPRPQNYMCGLTNSDGELLIRFISMQSMGDDRNGYGIYRFVLMPQNLRWELSDIYYWNKSPWDDQVFMETNIWSSEIYQEQMRTAENARTNWSYGNLTRFTAGARHYWQARLQTGEDARVTVKDQNGSPLPNKNFSVFLDAGVLSHTGKGGEIPILKVQTDESGVMTLPHASDFWYSFELLGTAEYCRPDAPVFESTVNGKISGAAGTIRYFKRIPRSVTIMVRDKSTQAAIADAEIREVVSFNSMAQGGPIGKTGADGRFATESLFTEHVLQLLVRKDGYEEFKFDMKDFVPGSTYVFDLVPKK